MEALHNPVARAARIVGLQPTVIASRAPHLLLEHSKNRGRASHVNARTLLQNVNNKLYILCAYGTSPRTHGIVPLQMHVRCSICIWIQTIQRIHLKDSKMFNFERCFIESRPRRAAVTVCVKGATFV